MSHTDTATIARLSNAAKRLLRDWAWHETKGLAEYRGAAASAAAKYELRDAGCGTTYEVRHGELLQLRITLGAKGRRIARKVAA